jgi:hypothetical protein
MASTPFAAWLVIAGITAAWLGMAFIAGSYFLAAGALIWLVLALLFDAKRRS